MADEGTLATTQQVLDSLGANPSTAQATEANTNRAILIAESDMEKAFGMLGKTPELVANYATITPSYYQWIAGIAADRAAWRIVNQDQNNWGLATTQSKLNVLDATWTGFLSDLTKKSSDIVSMMGLD
jgi:hypothetical protein